MGDIYTLNFSKEPLSRWEDGFFPPECPEFEPRPLRAFSDKAVLRHLVNRMLKANFTFCRVIRPDGTVCAHAFKLQKGVVVVLPADGVVYS